MDDLTGDDREPRGDLSPGMEIEPFIHRLLLILGESSSGVFAEESSSFGIQVSDCLIRPF